MNPRSESALAEHAPLFAEARGDIAVSFEFFPPKSEAMAATLWQSIETLAPLNPRFVSVTYGAGGSTRERTHQTVERIVAETPLTAAAHLTCVDASRDEVDAVARSYWEAGVRHLVALRGDPPEAGRAFAPPRKAMPVPPIGRGLKRVRRSTSRCLLSRGSSRGDVPRGRSRSFQAQGRRRRRSGDQPVLLLGRQLFPFPRPRCRRRNGDRDRAGNPAGHQRRPDPQVRRPVRRGNSWLDGRNVRRARCASRRASLIAATVAAELCGQLYAGGVRHFHFYTLNRAELAYAICHLLGVRA